MQLAKERQLIDELETNAAEPPIEGDENDSRNEQPERKLLRRELQAQALARLEDAARTQKDFENVIAWWDRLDANRERRERYHELSRSGDELPLDYGASEDALCFPDTLNGVLKKQQPLTMLEKEFLVDNGIDIEKIHKTNIIVI